MTSFPRAELTNHKFPRRLDYKCCYCKIASVLRKAKLWGNTIEWCSFSRSPRVVVTFHSKHVDAIYESQGAAQDPRDLHRRSRLSSAFPLDGAGPALLFHPAGIETALRGTDPLPAERCVADPGSGELLLDPLDFRAAPRVERHSGGRGTASRHRQAHAGDGESVPRVSCLHLCLHAP